MSTASATHTKASHTEFFLDTNVLYVLVKHGEHVFERLPIPDSIDHTTAEAHANRLRRNIVDALFIAPLPDKADRELIGNAVGYGCDVFVTCDRSTIIKKRNRLRQLPIRILTPRE